MNSDNELKELLLHLTGIHSEQSYLCVSSNWVTRCYRQPFSCICL